MTARDKNSINAGVKNGYWPLVKKVEPSKEIRSKFSVIQNKKTGEIEVSGDYRSRFWGENADDFEIVIDWTSYYPHSFKSPFAAYLIPADIQIGERVFVEDLIEDFIGEKWNQGDTYRLASCEAIWNGTDLEIQYDPDTTRTSFVG
jgi:hypothetical protein